MESEVSSEMAFGSDKDKTPSSAQSDPKLLITESSQSSQLTPSSSSENSDMAFGDIDSVDHRKSEVDQMAKLQ